MAWPSVLALLKTLTLPKWNQTFGLRYRFDVQILIKARLRLDKELPHGDGMIRFGDSGYPARAIVIAAMFYIVQRLRWSSLVSCFLDSDMERDRIHFFIRHGGVSAELEKTIQSIVALSKIRVTHLADSLVVCECQRAANPKRTSCRYGTNHNSLLSKSRSVRTKPSFVNVGRSLLLLIEAMETDTGQEAVVKGMPAFMGTGLGLYSAIGLSRTWLISSDCRQTKSTSNFFAFSMSPNQLAFTTKYAPTDSRKAEIVSLLIRNIPDFDLYEAGLYVCDLDGLVGQCLEYPDLPERMSQLSAAQIKDGIRSLNSEKHKQTKCTVECLEASHFPPVDVLLHIINGC